MPRRSKDSWARALDPFIEPYHAFTVEADAHLEKLTESELVAVIAACNTVTTTNVAWQAYRAAPYVLASAQQILHQRRATERP